MDDDVMLSATDTNSRWLVSYRQSTQARVRLFCFPSAGAGASVFGDWPEQLPDLVEVLGIQLPGREDRFTEAPLVSMQDVVEPLSDALAGFMDKPFAFFGHSTGAMIAFELARVFRRKALPQPRLLLVASQNGPRIRPDFFRHQLPDDEFIQILRDLGGVPAAILDDPAITRSLLPRIRADGAIAETYKYVSEPTLNTRIVLFRGQEDPFMSDEGVTAWRDETSQSFSMHLFPGGHFFLTENEAQIIDHIKLELSRFKDLTAASHTEAQHLQAKS